MGTLLHSNATRPLALRLSTAAELMTPDPLTCDLHTPIRKAAAVLDYYDLDAIPVVDETGRPAGVVTRAACADWQEFCVRSSPHGFVSEDLDRTTVAEIMNPVVETVWEQHSSREVVERLLEDKLRRVYVTDSDGQVVGVITAADVLRQLLAGRVGRRVHGAGAALLC